jgi:hypothetical protein
MRFLTILIQHCGDKETPATGIEHHDIILLPFVSHSAAAALHMNSVVKYDGQYNSNLLLCQQYISS